MPPFGGINDRGFSDSLARRFALREPDYGLSLTPEAGAVITPGDYPELRYHQGYRSWFRGCSQPAVAAQAARAFFRVLDASKVLVVLEQVVVSSVAQGELSIGVGYGPGNADLGTLNNAFFPRDGRQVPSAGSDVSISTGTAVAILSGASMLLSAFVPTQIPVCPMVLLPGNQLQLGWSVLNSGLDVMFTWRMRQFNDQENSP